jgi:hypothetical protein
MKPIIGIRGWKVDRDGMLLSIYYDAVWPRLSPLVAEDLNDQRGNPPAFSYTYQNEEYFGIHAFHHKGFGDLALSADLWIGSYDYDRNDPWGCIALGSVELWGSFVKKHARGYRAERAYPGELYLFKSHKGTAGIGSLPKAVRGNYGVPCHFLTEKESLDRIEALAREAAA